MPVGGHVDVMSKEFQVGQLVRVKIPDSDESRKATIADIDDDVIDVFLETDEFHDDEGNDEVNGLKPKDVSLLLEFEKPQQVKKDRDEGTKLNVQPET